MVRKHPVGGHPVGLWELKTQWMELTIDADLQKILGRSATYALLSYFARSSFLNSLSKGWHSELPLAPWWLM